MTDTPANENEESEAENRPNRQAMLGVGRMAADAAVDNVLFGIYLAQVKGVTIDDEVIASMEVLYDKTVRNGQ